MKKSKTVIIILIILSLLLLTACDGVLVPLETGQGNPKIQSEEEDFAEIEEYTGGGTSGQGSGGQPSSGSQPANEEETEEGEEPDEQAKDTTKPVIIASSTPLPNSWGWNNTAVQVTFTCEETGEIQSGIVTNTVEKSITVTTEGKNQSVTSIGKCIDGAGNIADPITVSNINIDKTPPKVSVTLPKDGKYELNEEVEITIEAQDILSGLEETETSKKIKIDTSKKGKNEITIKKGYFKDKAGNLSAEVVMEYEVIETAAEPLPPDDEEEEKPDVVFSQKWSGLGMGIYWHNTGYLDMLLDNGFEYLRIDIPTYTDSVWMGQSKATVKIAVSKGAKVIWGVSSNGTTITSANWLNFRQAILDAAAWAQSNGVYEFQLGNEEEWHVDGTSMTPNQLIQNLKSIAKDVKKIFTRGNISYSCFPTYINDWAATGRGDIDIIASNVYRGGNGYYDDGWKRFIDNLVSAFGVDHTYLTEFSVSWESLADYSSNEATQAAGITEMIDYMKNKGLERGLFFCFQHNDYGVIKEDGTYRTVLWNQALLNSSNIRLAQRSLGVNIE